MATLKVTKVYSVQMTNGKLRVRRCADIEDQLRLNSSRVYDDVNGLFVNTSRGGKEYHRIFCALTVRVPSRN